MLQHHDFKSLFPTLRERARQYLSTGQSVSGLSSGAFFSQQYLPPSVERGNRAKSFFWEEGTGAP